MLRSFGVALLLAVANTAWAQYVVSARAGTINLIAGEVSVDERPVEQKLNKFTTLKDGQVLRTGRGRAEVLLGPGVFVRLGSHATMRMVNSRLEDTQVEIQRGTALVEVIEIANGDNLHVLLDNTRTAFRGIGLHRFDADGGNLRVYGGHADVSMDARVFDVTRGRVLQLRGTATESRFDPHQKDPLLQWAASRSFHLFISNPGVRASLTNWEVSNTGVGSGIASDQNRSYYFNPDFGVTFIQRGPAASVPGFPDLLPPADAYPRGDPSPRPSTSQPIPKPTYPGSAAGVTFPC